MGFIPHFGFALYDIITSVWDKFLYHMAGLVAVGWAIINVSQMTLKQEKFLLKPDWHCQHLHPTLKYLCKLFKGCTSWRLLTGEEK